jgi:hypothetical protein
LTKDWENSLCWCREERGGLGDGAVWDRAVVEKIKKYNRQKLCKFQFNSNKSDFSVEYLKKIKLIILIIIFIYL